MRMADAGAPEGADCAAATAAIEAARTLEIARFIRRLLLFPLPGKTRNISNFRQKDNRQKGSGISTVSGARRVQARRACPP
jgi:hypothetical protein